MTRLFAHIRATIAIVATMAAVCASANAWGSVGRFSTWSYPGLFSSHAGVLGIDTAYSDSAKGCRTYHSKHKRHGACKQTHRKTKKDTGTAPSSSPRVFSVLQAASTGEGSSSPLEIAIQSVLETPCQNTRLLPTAANLQLIREAIFCLVNQERARDNEPPLTPNAALQNAAQAHSEDMIAHNYFGHVSPGGLEPAERALNADYIPSPLDGYTIGENIAWGLAVANHDTPQTIVAAWISSPDHLENILEARYQDTGIGVIAQLPPYLSHGQPGAVYTQDFGAIEN
ncbi:MAG TPA: CAP domain-containing protein [Solirubrobacteraceae bacterium]